MERSSRGPFDVDAYLRRIDHPPVRAPTAESLATLHRAHLLAVPFENLDIHRKHPIRLEEDALFDKVVRRRRGGFCYELNGAFAALLRALGFEVGLLSARVRGDAGLGPELDHLALVVTLEERWLVDVGFGDSFSSPLRLDVREPQIDGDRAYCIREDDDRGLWLDERRDDGPFQASYRFTLERRALTDFDAMCLFHQTSPESHFTRQTVCSLPTREGRITLRGEGLLTTRGREKSEVPLPTEADRMEALKRWFGIVL